jgi:hypothetical protein
MNYLRLLSLCLVIALLAAIVNYYYFSKERNHETYESVDSSSSESLNTDDSIESSTESSLDLDASDDELNQRIDVYSNDVGVLIDRYDRSLDNPTVESALREKLESSEDYKNALLEKFKREKIESGID